MDLKKTIGCISRDILLKQAANKILPMEEDKPKLSGKAKVAGALAIIATIVGALSQYFSG